MSNLAQYEHHLHDKIIELVSENNRLKKELKELRTEKEILHQQLDQLIINERTDALFKDRTQGH